MSYHIYTTNGIILKRTPMGEANILLYILTEDLGLIISSARSARLSVSKLRSALQEYTLVSISCIKSKNGWKITNVVEDRSFFFGYPEYTHRVISQVVSLLLQMIVGEFPHKEIFEITKSGFTFLKDIEEEYVGDFEILIVLRILQELGYVKNDSETLPFLENKNDWTVSLFKEIRIKKEAIIGVINKALRESHL